MSLTGLGEVANLADSIIGKIWPDASQAQKDALTFQLAQMQAQMDTNKAEATNVNMFVAGWRPFIGWVCGSGLAYQFVVSPLLTWGTELFGKTIALPALDMGTLLTLLFGMLGLGGMRTFEKVNGINAGH
jgi:hypothetical protein